MIDYKKIEAIPEIETLLSIVQFLPTNATIVEIGTYLGGSTVRLAEAMPNASITTVDCCEDGSNWNPPYNEYVQKYLVDQVLLEPVSKKHLFNNIARFSNITFIEGYSPDCINNWDKEIDLYFEDGNHFNPYLKRNLMYWSNFVKVGGYLAAHDYCDECPDTIIEIDNMIDRGWKKILQDRRLIVLKK